MIKKTIAAMALCLACGSANATWGSYEWDYDKEWECYWHCPEDPPVSVPEPSVLTLMALGLLGFGFTRRRRH